MGEEKEFVRFSTSDARKSELLGKVKDAVEYFEKAFHVKLTDQQVLQIVERKIKQDKENVLLRRIGTITEADYLFLQETVKEKKNGSREGNAGGASGVSAGGNKEGEANQKGAAA